MDKELLSIFYKIQESKFKQYLVYKGGFVLNMVYEVDRRTTDIDCDFVNVMDEDLEDITEEFLNLLREIPNSEITKVRRPTNTSSLGIRIRINNKNYGLDVRVTGRVVAVKELEVVGEVVEVYDVNAILADKLSVIRSGRITRRVKDLYDIYKLCDNPDLDIAKIKRYALSRNFVETEILNEDTVSELEHAYSTLKLSRGEERLDDKPEFKEVIFEVFKLYKEIFK